MLCGDIVLSELLDVVFVVGAKRGGGGEGEKTPSFIPFSPFDAYHAG